MDGPGQPFPTVVAIRDVRSVGDNFFNGANRNKDTLVCHAHALINVVKDLNHVYFTELTVNRQHSVMWDGGQESTSCASCSMRRCFWHRIPQLLINYPFWERV